MPPPLLPPQDESNKQREEHVVAVAAMNGEISKLDSNVRFTAEENSRFKIQLAELKESGEKERERLVEAAGKTEVKYEAK